MQTKPEEIGETLEGYGIEVGESLVSRVKVQMFRDEAKATRKRPNTIGSVVTMEKIDCGK